MSDSCDATHLRQDVDALVAASVGQVENRAAPVGHGGGLQLQHEIRAVGLGQGGLGVLLRTHHMEGLQHTGKHPLTEATFKRYLKSSIVIEMIRPD